MAQQPQLLTQGRTELLPDPKQAEVTGQRELENTNVLSSTLVPGAERPDTKTGYNSEHERPHGN